MRKRKLTGLVVTLFLILIVLSTPVGGTVLPDKVNFTLMPGTSVNETTDVNITLPVMADILFSFDLTSSMDIFLGNVREDWNPIMTELVTSGVDLGYGVSSHSDYPSFYDYSSTCGYSDFYGNGELPQWKFDYAYGLNQSITTDQSSVLTAINGLEGRFGFDNAEAYSRVFYESYTDTNTSWRQGAKRVMVHVGDDSVPHDCDLNEGISGREGIIWTTGGDPGRDGVANTDDDLDFQTVLAAMEAHNVTLIECQPSTTNFEYWTSWTGITGGQLLITGETTFANDVTAAVMEELTPPSSMNVHIIADPGYEDWVNSSRSYDVTTNQINKIQVTFTVPVTWPAGDNTFNVYVVDDAGVRYGSQNVTIHVVIPSPVNVTSISPNTGVNTTTVKINNLIGTGFVYGAGVNLTMTGYPDIAASSVNFVTSKKIMCTFNLTGAQPGYWNVVVTNPDGGSGSLPSGFAITDGVTTKGRK
jgi:hypothetical protein